MSIQVARRVTLIAIAAYALPALSAVPEWACEAAEEAWTYTEHRDRVEAEADMALELEKKLETAKYRIQQKEMVYQAIEAGRLSLFDAAKQFRAMDRDWPGLGEVIYDTPHAGSDEEVAASCVIRGMRARLEDGPPSVAEIVARMETAFTTRFGHKPPGSLTRFGR